MRWVVCLLLALCICLIATTIFPDFLVPYSVWGNDSGTRLPPAIRIELPIFTGIVLPPTWTAERLGYRRTQYGQLAASHAGRSDASSLPPALPPLMAALEFLLVGWPFWFAVAAGTSALFLRLRRRPARPR